MITDYLQAPRALERLRSGCIGPYVDGFADALADDGFSPHTIRGYLRIAAHFGSWADARGTTLASFNEDLIRRFRRHLSRCRCDSRSKGVFGRAESEIRRLLVHLRSQDVICPDRTNQPRVTSAICERFATWMLRNRGVTTSTTARYQLALRPFLAQMGENPERYDVKGIRSFVIEQLGTRSRSETRSAVSAIRAFLRFLVAEGQLRPGIEYCVPTVPEWRLAALPRYIEASEVERVVRSCDLSKGHGMRDHAILLLLARLGLRAGDIVTMKLEDIDWKRATLRVHGKGRRDVLLPLPQEAGDAILAYLEHGRPKSRSDRLFLTVVAPIRPFTSSPAISDIVRFALRRAGIENPPSRGAHLLRHSAATAMLRAGSSLDTIALMLRHQSPDTTAHYAKVDVAMLEQIVQPWPGGVLC